MEAWLAALLSTLTNETKRGISQAATPQNVLQNEALTAARSALTQLEKVMEQQAAAVADVAADVAPEKRGWFGFGGGKKGPPKPVADADVLLAVSNALKALAELMAEDGARQRRVLESGGFALLTQFLLSGHFTQAVSTQQWQSAREGAGVLKERPKPPAKVPKQKRPYVKRHALRVLANLSIHPQLGALLGGEQRLVDWLEEVAEGAMPSQRGDLKLRSFAKQTLLHLQFWRDRGPTVGEDTDVLPWPRYLDGIYLLDPASEHFRTWKGYVRKKSEEESDAGRQEPTRDGENQPWQASDRGPNGALGKDTSLEASGQERKRRLFELSISGEASRQVEGRGASEQEGMGASGQGSQRRPCDEGSAVEASVDGSRGGQAQQSGEKVLPTSVTQQDTTDKSKETGVDLNQIEGNSAPQEQHPQTAVPLEKETIEIASDSSTESASISASQAEKLQVGGTSGVKSQPANAELALKLESSAVNAARDVSPGLKPGVQDSQTLPSSRSPSEPVFDVVFIHGLMGGPYKTWRMTDDKTSAVKAGGLVEDLGQEDRPKEGDGCWPTDWLAKDLPSARLLSIEYKTNLTEWSGATLPLQELSAHLLERLVAAGVGDRPVVFVTHSMGGLVAKQMLQLVRAEERYRALGQAVRGIVFYSCPHFGSRLADLSSRMGVVLRPAAAVSLSSFLFFFSRFLRPSVCSLCRSRF
jgi:pimeloyl-ACP methyl ester carboxylesterase